MNRDTRHDRLGSGRTAMARALDRGEEVRGDVRDTTIKVADRRCASNTVNREFPSAPWLRALERWENEGGRVLTADERPRG